MKPASTMTLAAIAGAAQVGLLLRAEFRRQVVEGPDQVLYGVEYRRTRRCLALRAEPLADHIGLRYPPMARFRRDIGCERLRQPNGQRFHLTTECNTRLPQLQYTGYCVA